MLSSDARNRFRPYPLDGALLWFQPSTGRSVRVQSERTRTLERRAPRVVMFGITNRCNLSCAFCSRDVARMSEWTVESAARVLGDLARAGTLEVAFGGGEPFAFKGFAELISQLYETTQLALNVTTNGTLLNESTFEPFRGRLGQVRVSIYDDLRWLTAARALSSAGQLWGANILVDDRRLSMLPALLAELAALGCHDVSLLGYVGGDPAAQLSPAGRQRLATMIADAPLPCRISVCFGESLPVARFFDGADGAGDCGAGRDFITLTPDQRIQSCSFQDRDLAADTSEQVLQMWRARAPLLNQPATRQGCARRLTLAREQRSLPPLVAWRAFSGNNSGECVLVGKFASGADAERFVAELEPSWAPDSDYSEEWRALFVQEGVASVSLRDEGEIYAQTPSTLAAVGRSVVALSYDAGDAFPELRALAWKRGGFVVANGVHLHGSPPLLAAIRCRSPEDAAALAARAEGLKTFVHGDLLFALVPEATNGRNAPFEQHVQTLKNLAAGRPLGAELVLVDHWDESMLLAAKQRLGVELRNAPRLIVAFHGADASQKARRYASELSDTTAHVFGATVLIEGLHRRKRAAVLALREGASVAALDGSEVLVHGWFFMQQPARTKGTKTKPMALDRDALGRALSVAFGRSLALKSEWNGVSVVAPTPDPARALRSIIAAAQSVGVEVRVSASDVAPLEYVLRRLIEDVSA